MNNPDTQNWNDEDDDLMQDNSDFSAALASLEEHLHEQDVPNEDETELDEHLFQEGAAFSPEINEDGEPEAASYVEHTNQDADAFESHLDEDAENSDLHEDAEADTRVADELDELDGNERLAALDAVEAEEAEAEHTEMNSEEGSEAVAFESEDSSPLIAALDAQGPSDDFDLGTLNQLVDDIRQESQKVNEMKEAVAQALQLIQEMSESLKS